MEATFRRTFTYTGPKERVAMTHSWCANYDITDSDGIRRTSIVSKLRTLRPPKPSTAAQDKARSVSWLQLQIAAAVGHLGSALTRGVRLPSAQDDADLREALALLTAVDRRRRERNNLNVREKA